jgi:hypothetical protein
MFSEMAAWAQGQAGYVTRMRHVYLHGFASSPLSRKAMYLADVLKRVGVEMFIPDLNVPNFEHVTLTAMVEEAEHHLDEPVVLWGSSLGAWVAATVAARNPDRVFKLMLLAPAFEFPRNFPPRVAELIPAWKRGETVPIFHHRFQKEVPLGPDLWRDCARWAGSPSVTTPAYVLAARYDGVVPLPPIEAWAQANRAQLEYIDATHEMVEDLPGVATLCLKALALPLPELPKPPV